METNRWSVINVDATDTGFNEKQTGVLRTNVKARANTISIKTTEPNFSMTTSLGPLGDASDYQTPSLGWETCPSQRRESAKSNEKLYIVWRESNKSNESI